MLNNSDYKIVIVDDEREICESIQSILKASGYCIETFADAQSAYNYISNNIGDQPDIVITDYKLAGDNGLNLLSKIKTNFSEISVIIMTGYGDKKLIIETLRFGAEDFIDKPLNPKDLRKSVEKILFRRIEKYQLQKQKTSAVIHEINNHLSIIKGSAQIMKFETCDESKIPDLIINQVNCMNNSIKTMLAPDNFINSAIKVKKAKINLKSIIDSVVIILGNNAEGKKIAIETDISNIEARVDINYMRQVIMNILLNAILYSPQESKIQIKLFLENENIVIQISDEGIGIADDLKEKIFNYGFRINSEIKGCGIGLFFAANVIKAHKGKIEVMDNKPKGSIFRIILNNEE